MFGFGVLGVGCWGRCKMRMMAMKGIDWRQSGAIATITLISVTVNLLLAQPAAANSWPPMAVSLFSLPFFASLRSVGMALVLIVLCEAWIVQQRQPISFRRSLRLVTEANLLSTVAGLVAVMFFSGLPYSLFYQPGNLFYVALFWGIALLFFLSIGRCTASFLKRWIRPKRYSFLRWSLAWVVLLVGDLFLMGAVGQLVYAKAPLLRVLKLVGAAVYLAIGFLLSLVVEGAWLQRRLPECKRLEKTILLMNLRSYAYIAIPITIVILGHQFNRW